MYITCVYIYIYSCHIGAVSCMWDDIALKCMGAQKCGRSLRLSVYKFFQI